MSNINISGKLSVNNINSLSANGTIIIGNNVSITTNFAIKTNTISPYTNNAKVGITTSLGVDTISPYTNGANVGITTSLGVNTINSYSTENILMKNDVDISANLYVNGSATFKSNVNIVTNNPYYCYYPNSISYNTLNTNVISINSRYGPQTDASAVKLFNTNVYPFFYNITIYATQPYSDSTVYFITGIPDLTSTSSFGNWPSNLGETPTVILNDPFLCLNLFGGLSVNNVNLVIYYQFY